MRKRHSKIMRYLPVFQLLLMALPIHVACASASDARPLTQAERRLFLPMICTGARPDKRRPQIYENICATLPGYRANGRTVDTPDLRLSLTSIIRGSLTAPGATEAYITYRGSFESHATRSGGGILFHRAGSVWQRVDWYPGEKRDGCLAIPNSMPVEMLCRSGDGHADSSYETIDVAYVPPQPINVTTKSALLRPIWILRDNTYHTCQEKYAPNRMRSDVADPCSYWQKGHGFLLELGKLKRSHAPGIFAELPVKYASPDSVEKACKAQCFLDLPEQSGTITFALDGFHLKVAMPIPMQDYQINLHGH